MLQEPVTQPDPFMSPFDQARDISHNDGCIFIQIGNAQVGFDRGEWIISDLGVGIRYGRQKAGFTRIGHADDADIRQQFQFQPNIFFFRGFAFFSSAWSLVA